MGWGREGITLLAHRGTLEWGTGHGVLVLSEADVQKGVPAALESGRNGTFACRGFLEKVHIETMLALGAAVDGHGCPEHDGDGLVLVDSDLVISAAAAAKLASIPVGAPSGDDGDGGSRPRVPSYRQTDTQKKAKAVSFCLFLVSFALSEDILIPVVSMGSLVTDDKGFDNQNGGP